METKLRAEQTPPQGSPGQWLSPGPPCPAPDPAGEAAGGQQRRSSGSPFAAPRQLQLPPLSPPALAWGWEGAARGTALLPRDFSLPAFPGGLWAPQPGGASSREVCCCGAPCPHTYPPRLRLPAARSGTAGQPLQVPPPNPWPWRRPLAGCTARHGTAGPCGRLTRGSPPAALTPTPRHAVPLRPRRALPRAPQPSRPLRATRHRRPRARHPTPPHPARRAPQGGDQPAGPARPAAHVPARGPTHASGAPPRPPPRPGARPSPRRSPAPVPPERPRPLPGRRLDAAR